MLGKRHFEIRVVKEKPQLPSEPTPPAQIVIEPNKVEAYAVKTAIFGVSIYGAIKVINTVSTIAIARLA